MTFISLLTILLLILALWLLFDFIIGRKIHLRRLERKSFPFRKSNIDIFTEGPILFDDFFAELKRATHHIHILFYIVKNDQISTEFLTILKEKARDGVEVRLLLDRIGSFRIKRKTIQSLKNCGITFAFAQKPKLPFLFYTSQVRNHQKITVIDGKVGYIGGYNVGKEYIDLDPKLSPWRDYHLKIIGEGVNDLQTEFLTNWYEETAADLLQKEIYFPNNTLSGESQHQIISTKGAFLEETFSSLLRNAKKRIVIGTPYFIPSKRLLNDLTAALARGVTLIILIPHKSDHLLVKEAAFPYFRKLLPLGALVYEFYNGFYHAKTIIIDEDICDIGTANFDKRSLFLNYEVNCYIYDQLFIKKVLKIMETDIQDSRQLTLNDVSGPNPVRICKEWLARLLSYFL